MRTRRWVRHVAVIAAALMVLTACGSDDAPDAAPDAPDAPDAPEAPEEPEAPTGPSGTLRYGMNFTMADYNNLTKPGEGHLAIVYEKLITLEEDGVTLVPQLAHSWDEEPDAITLYLEEGVVFTDGTPFDADAVVANIERVSTTPGAWQFIFDAVDEVVVVDEYTVRLELSRPDQGLLPNLARRGAFMLSPAMIESGDYSVPIGTGPWVLNTDETIHESIYVYDFFEDYWAPETIGPERIEMVIILENESRYNAVLSGDVDVASVELPSVAQAEAAGLDVVTWPALRHGLNFIDLNGVFADEDVRKAICYGINFDEINVAQYDGYSQWHAQRHNPGQVGYVEGLPGYPYDPDRAREHLEAAGNPDVTFNFASSPPQATQNELFRAQMAEIGITVELDALTSPQYFSEYQTGAYDAYFNTSSAEDTGIPGFYHFRWTPNGTANPLNNSVPELDEIIERGFAAETLAEQTEIWEEFTQTVYDMALACGFYDLPHAAIWSPDRVENVRGQVWFPSHLRYRDIRVLD